MKKDLTRRRFLHRTITATSFAVASFGFEEKALLGQSSSSGAATTTPLLSPLPQGKLGKLSVSRLICGGNLISGFAHSRDLIYVSPLLQHYFTDEKVFQTLELCERNGINTAILRLDENTLRIIKTYWKERGGKIQWICQASVTEKGMETQIKQAIDNGAVAVYTHGGVGDTWVKEGRAELLDKAVDIIKKNGAVSGIAGHDLTVHKTCVELGIEPDFFMKTFNSKRYWSAGPMPRLDSVWEETPEETAAFMRKVNRPWIAYKVLGAGAIHPNDGFQYAFELGADFICVGMFDFQVAQDASIAAKVLDKTKERVRPWCG
jgi:hypothetical protein